MHRVLFPCIVGYFQACTIALLGRFGECECDGLPWGFQAVGFVIPLGFVKEWFTLWYAMHKQHVATTCGRKVPAQWVAATKLLGTQQHLANLQELRCPKVLSPHAAAKTLHCSPL